MCPAEAPQARIKKDERRAPEADLFAGAASAGGEEEVVTSAAVPRVGQRNETSVLFSLTTLKSEASSSHDASRTTTESSALIDLRALSSSAKEETTSSPTDDIMNLSGGGAFASPLLAPPIELEAERPPILPSRSRVPVLLCALGLGIAAMITFGIVKRPPGASSSATPPPVSVETTTPPEPSAPVAVVTAIIPAEPTTPAPTQSVRVARASPTATMTAPAKSSATPATTASAPPKCCPGETETTCQMRISVGAPCGDTRTTTTPTTAATFDRPAAARALGISVASCKRADGPTGPGHARITFQSNGTVSAVEVEAPYGGTSVGACVAQRYRSASVPAFTGAPLTVGKTFSVD